MSVYGNGLKVNFHTEFSKYHVRIQGNLIQSYDHVVALKYFYSSVFLNLSLGGGGGML